MTEEYQRCKKKTHTHTKQDDNQPNNYDFARSLLFKTIKCDIRNSENNVKYVKRN